ncbi:MAG: hypothetical protein ACKO6B_14500, partial [Planctomycetia bacterium]
CLRVGWRDPHPATKALHADFRPRLPTIGSPIVFSLLGVLGIALVLLVVVVLTAGLVLGK